MKQDTAAKIAAAEYPLPDKFSTGDEDTWNGYKRKQLTRKIRAAIRAERNRCLKIVKKYHDKHIYSAVTRHPSIVCDDIGDEIRGDKP